MKKSLIALFIISTYVLSCSNNNEEKTTTDKNNYEKTKEDLRDKEEKNPQNFLFVDGHDKRNIIGQTVIKGDITSKASVAVFKDIDINLSFYSKTRALLETDKETVFEVLNPGETKSFKTKYFAPKGTDSVAFAIVSAKIVKQ